MKTTLPDQQPTNFIHQPTNQLRRQLINCDAVFGLLLNSVPQLNVRLDLSSTGLL